MPFYGPVAAFLRLRATVDNKLAVCSSNSGIQTLTYEPEESSAKCFSSDVPRRESRPYSLCIALVIHPSEPSYGVTIAPENFKLKRIKQKCGNIHPRIFELIYLRV